MTKSVSLETKNSLAKNIIRWLTRDCERLQTLITLLVLILMIIGFSSQSNRFFEITNLLNVACRVSPLLIVASAATLVMISRGLDLSVGSVVAASAVLAAYLSSHGMNFWLAYLCAIALGTLIGITNAFVIVRMQVSPIIATLGTLNIARGIAYLISPSAILVGLPKEWDLIGKIQTSGPFPQRWLSQQQFFCYSTSYLHVQFLAVMFTP